MSTRLREWLNFQTRDQLLWRLAFLEETPKIPDKLSCDCKDFLGKCLIKNPEQRWTTKMLLDHPFIQKEYQILSPTCNT